MNEIIKKLLKENDILTVIIIAILIVGSLFLIKKGIEILISKEMADVNKGNNRNIEELKAELDKQRQQLEYIHQVSQPTYQKLFEKKIEVYQTLLKLLLDYERTDRDLNALDDDKRPDFEGMVSTLVSRRKKIAEVIEENEVFISDDLFKISKELITQSTKFDRHNEKYDTETDNKIYDATSLNYSKFKEILHRDVSKIKTKINLD